MKTKFALGLLLLFATTSRTQAGTVDIRLEVSDLDGIAISTVEVGDTFLLRVYVQDLRAQAQGVFSAFLDVIYDPLVSVAGPILRGPQYPNGFGGNISVPGLLDEIGGMDGFSPLDGGEFLLLSLPFKANAVGTVNFVGNPADLIWNETTVFGWDTPVPISQIEYGAVVIDVVPQSNTAPTADAGPDQEVECTGPDGAMIQLNGWGSDPNGDTLVFEWSVAEGAAELLDASDPQTLGMFAIGGHRLILTASDGKGGVATDEVYITVYPTPDVLLANLINHIPEMNLPIGVENALGAPLRNALQSLHSGNAEQRNDAVNKLQAFLNMVDAQAGKALMYEQAEELSNAALEIIAMLM